MHHGCENAPTKARSNQKRQCGTDRGCGPKFGRKTKIEIRRQQFNQRGRHSCRSFYFQMSKLRPDNGERAMKLTIKATKITYDKGVRHFTLEPEAMQALLREHFDAEVAIVDENGEELRTINTKDYLAAATFLRIQG
jgi:hypothetical protein